jgi:ATP-binding cassette subfamily B protein
MNTLFIVLALNMLAWSCRRLGQFAILYTDAKVMTDLVRTAFDKLLLHSYGFFTNNFSGSLVRKVTRLSKSFEDVSDQIFFNVLPVIISLAGIIIVLFSRNKLLGEIYLGWAVVFLAFQLFLARYKMRYNLASAEKDSEVTGKLADTLTNETAVKLF